MVYRLLCLLIGYVFALFSTGRFVSKIYDVDITKKGSGNTGATNSLRVLGIRAGVLVLLGDFLKCFIACMIARVLALRAPALETVLVFYAGLGAIIGHNYPINNNFKGGKGISCTAGLVVGLLDWRIVLICLIVFSAIVYFTQYVSLASMVMTCSFLATWIIFSLNGWYSVGAEVRTETWILAALVPAFAIWRHRANIVRLIHGEESRIFHKKKK